MKKDKTDEQIQEELSFISSIRNIVSDWETRTKKIRQLYLQSKNNQQKNAWVSIVESERPHEISMEEWRRFVSLSRSYDKQSKIGQTVVQKVIRKVDEVVATVSQLDIFPRSFNTSGF